MPNLYATPTEIKAALPNAIRSTTTTYDAELLRLAGEVSRYVENHTHRVFHPTLATRYFHGNGRCELRVPDLLSITSVSVSEDDGQTYTLLAATDYFASVEGDINSPKSWTHLHLDVNGDWVYWPRGQRSVKVVGVWAYVDDRNTAWEDSTDEVESDPLAADGTSCTVNDHDGADERGITPRFAPGQLYRIESEFIEGTGAAANALTIVRGRNGTTAAAHVQNTQIDIWRPPEPVKQAVLTQCTRTLMRAIQGYSDARAEPETSQMIWVRALDPDVIANLAPYVIPVHA